MKAEIRKDGFIHLTAESPAEAFAIRTLMPDDEDAVCGKCNQVHMPIIMNMSILNPDSIAETFAQFK